MTVRPGKRSAMAFVLAVLVVSAFPRELESQETSGVWRTSIPMRDGVALATDIYLPDTTGSYPAILIRTPYNKNWMAQYGQYFVRFGYVVAIQDVRGRWGSQGEWEPFLHEGPDGFDTVEWLATREVVNGRVGMLGGSYAGSVQFAAAIQHPPHLVTIVPTVAPAMPFSGLPYDGGAFLMGWAARWTDIVENAKTGMELQAKLLESTTGNWTQALGDLPVINLDLSVAGKEVPFYREWIRHNTDGPFWAPVQYLEALRQVEIPVFLQSGWFDGGNRGSRLAFEALTSGGNRNVRLLMGPWVHSDRGTRFVNGMDMGEEAERDLMAEYRVWFDRWLKATPNGMEEEDPVELYLMGSNRWLTGEEFPLEGTRLRPLYLGDSPDPSSAGRLTWDAPTEEGFFDTYLYNPGNPTPSFYASLKSGSMDEYQERLPEREDVLMYETDPLQEPLSLAGPISLALFASSSAVDTDWVGTLYAVTPEGDVNVLGMTFGILRARYRESMAAPSPLEPGRVYPFTLDLSHTAVTVPAGQRLRLEVASAAYPEYSRNLNTGGHNEMETAWVEATQRVYRTPLYPSHLLLPILEPPPGR